MAYSREEPYDDFEVPLREYVFALARKWWVVLGVFIITVAAAFFFVGREADVYETQTKLLITLPVSERVNPDTPGSVTPLISVQTLSSLAVANDLLALIIEELDLKDAVTNEPIAVESLAGMVEANVETSGQNAQASALPILTLTVRGGDPGQIREIASTWATIFIRENSELFTTEAARSYDFIATAYADAQRTLESKQAERLSYTRDSPLDALKAQFEVIAARYRDSFSRLQASEADLAEAEAQLEYYEGNLLALRQAEVARNVYRKANPTAPLQTQLDVVSSQYRASLATLQQAEAQLVIDTALVESLKAAVETEPKTITLTRGIANESIFQVFGNNPSAAQVEALQKVAIPTEEPNPVYSTLVTKLRDAQVSVARNTITIADLEVRTATQKAEIERLQGTIADIQLKDAELGQEIVLLDQSLISNLASARTRVTNLKATVEDLSARTATYDEQIRSLSERIARAETTVARVDREIGVVLSNVNGLAQQLQDAGLAQAGQEGAIRVVESAIEPRFPQPKSTQRNLLLAGVLGLFMGVFAAFFLHWLQTPPGMAAQGPGPSGRNGDPEEASG